MLYVRHIVCHFHELFLPSRIIFPITTNSSQVHFKVSFWHFMQMQLQILISQNVFFSQQKVPKKTHEEFICSRDPF